MGRIRKTRRSPSGLAALLLVWTLFAPSFHSDRVDHDEVGAELCYPTPLPLVLRTARWGLRPGATFRCKPTRRTIHRGLRVVTEYTLIDADSGDDAESQSWAGTSLAFVPSEFQGIRFEVSQVDDGEDTFTEFFFQDNVTI